MESSGSGIIIGQNDSETASAYNLPAGIYVSSVSEQSPAAKAGIHQGMMITAFDEKSISSVTDLKNALQYYAAGETIDLTVQVNSSGNYEEQTIPVTLASTN